MIRIPDDQFDDPTIIAERLHDILLDLCGIVDDMASEYFELQPWSREKQFLRRLEDLL